MFKIDINHFLPPLQCFNCQFFEIDTPIMNQKVFLKIFLDILLQNIRSFFFLNRHDLFKFGSYNRKHHPAGEQNNVEPVIIIVLLQIGT